MAELVLKGVNILMNRCKIGRTVLTDENSELHKMLEDETNVLFKLAHHNVFRIQIQSLKLLFQFVKGSIKSKSKELQIEKE